MSESLPRLSDADLEQEAAVLLPDKEVLSVLDLFVNVDLAIDLAAPVDLAVAANANVAAPVDAAATANVITFGSTAQALSDQGVIIDQHISGEAIATAPQDASIDQTNDVVDGGTTAGADTGGTTGTDPIVIGGTTGTDATGTTTPTAGETTGTTSLVGDITNSGLLDGPLLNIDVDASIDADLAAPIAGAVAANANAAVPIDAAVAANVISFNSEATAIAEQDAIITQSLDDVTASATADQTADIAQ